MNNRYYYYNYLQLAGFQMRKNKSIYNNNSNDINSVLNTQHNEFTY